MDGVTPQYKPPDWVDPKILIANKKNLSSRKKKNDLLYVTLNLRSSASPAFITDLSVVYHPTMSKSIEKGKSAKVSWAINYMGC